MTGLRSEVARVVERGNCTGCGGCALLSDTVRMGDSSDGFRRPVVTGDDTRREVVSRFRAVCPGVTVRAARWAGARDLGWLGPVYSAWQGWAADDDVRQQGSSGGVLTALSAWLVDTGQADQVVAAGRSTTEGRRTVPLQLRTRSEVLGTAGSRYAPVSTVSGLQGATDSAVLVGKPCEATAARALTPDRIVLSFFCAGTPSQDATDDLLRQGGVDPGTVTELRYRGDGWPGRFVGQDEAGHRMEMNYEQSWGEHLGRRLQSRCKICPDGTGAHADIAVGDYWQSDDSGYPLFADAAGNSVVLARNERGHQLLKAAVAAGVLVLDEIDLSTLDRVQPLQVTRRRLLVGRMVGRWAARRRPPRYRGFGLVQSFLLSPKEQLKAARGAYRRAR